MKYIIAILFLMIGVTSFAQVYQEDTTKYMKNPAAYPSQLRGFWATSIFRLPDTTNNRPQQGVPGALGRNTAGTQTFIWNGSQWVVNSGGGGVTIDSVFITSIDSIFITNTDSIFIISGNDTIYIGINDSPRDTAYLTAQRYITILNDDSTYKPNGQDVAIGLDSALLFDDILSLISHDTTIAQIVDTANFIVDSISNSPPIDAVSGNKYLVGTTATGAFAGHENDIAELVGATYTFTDATAGDQLIVDNAATFGSYQWNGTAWIRNSIIVRWGGDRGIGSNAWIGRTDKEPVYFKSWDKVFLYGDTTRDVYLPKYAGVENQPLFYKPGLNGKIDTARFNLPVYASPAISDSVMYVQSGVIKYGTAASGGGSTNLNIGSGYRLAVPGTNNIKTLHAGTNITLDSVANTDEITINSSGGLNGTGYVKMATTTPSYVPIIPVADGGTGTATPSLVAGNNMAITGSWPNQTVATSAYLNLDSLVIDAPGAGTTIPPKLVLKNSSTSGLQWPPALRFYGNGSGSANFFDIYASFNNTIQADTLNFISNSGRIWYVTRNGNTSQAGTLVAGAATLSSVSTTTITSNAANSGPLVFSMGTDAGASTPSGRVNITFTGNNNRTVPVLNMAGTYSGTGQYTDIKVDRTETGLSGSVQRFLSFQRAGTEVFGVNNFGMLIAARPISFTGSTPANTPGTGSGTSPTVTVTGNDAAGYVTIATGSSPTASGNIVTVTFSTALTNTPKSIIITPANVNAATELAKFYVDQSTASTTAWIIKNTAVALTASTTYIFYYSVTQ